MTEKTRAEWMEIAKNATEQAKKAEKVELSQLREEFEEKLTAKGYTFADILTENEAKKDKPPKKKRSIPDETKKEIALKFHNKTNTAQELAEEYEMATSQIYTFAKKYPKEEEAPSGDEGS